MQAVQSVIELLRLRILDFTVEMATQAAALRLKTREYGLSLADRACLGGAIVTGLPVLTADRIWSEVCQTIGIRCNCIR